MNKPKIQIAIELKTGEILLTEVSKKELEELVRRMENNKTLSIDGNVISGWYVARIMLPDAYQKYLDHKEQKSISSTKWKCKYGYWHEKGEQCGHGNQLKSFNELDQDSLAIGELRVLSESLDYPEAS
jgi:hypothetical protein